VTGNKRHALVYERERAGEVEDPLDTPVTADDTPN